MAIDIKEVSGNIVWVEASEQLTDDDYETFVPRMEALIKQWGRLRMLLEMKDFRGWDTKSVWEEFKFHSKHRKDLKRVAVVGEKQWERWATRLSRIFTGSDVRYFDHAELDDARGWIEMGW